MRERKRHFGCTQAFLSPPDAIKVTFIPRSIGSAKGTLPFVDSAGWQRREPCTRIALHCGKWRGRDGSMASSGPGRTWILCSNVGFEGD